MGKTTKTASELMHEMRLVQIAMREARRRARKLAGVWS